MTEPATPLLRQYHAIKKQHPNALLLFRLGDFYELFFDDAILASKILQITLTARNREKGHPVPMCGVPYHAAEAYIVRLIRAGQRVAICDQMEEAGAGKKLVRREVVRVITPGTVTGVGLLDPKENNFLAAVARNPDRTAIGLAYVDLSTGDFRATEFSGDAAETRLRDELGILRPREILLPHLGSLFPEIGAPELDGLAAVKTRLDEWVFQEDLSTRVLEEQFRVASLDGFGLSRRPLAASAAGAIVHYLRETSAIAARGDSPASPALPRPPGLEHLDAIRYYEQQDSLILDQVTVRNLELIDPVSGDDPSATLVSSLDDTATGMGARLLRGWILRPEISLDEIEARLDAVSEFKSRTVERDEIHRTLEAVLDLERLTSRITLAVATPRDLVALRKSLEQIPVIRGFLSSESRAASTRIAALHTSLDELADVREAISSAIADEPPAQPTEPGMIRRGYDSEIDELRDLSRTSKQTIAAMEERERKRTGIASLKIRFNQVFGYYIEISKANQHHAPHDYERKQTLVNAERFTSTELKEYERKVLDADERIIEIERRLYAELRERIAREAMRLRRTAAAIAQLDVLVNLARLAASGNYARPAFSEQHPGERGELLIVGGRHPVIERLLSERGERFVPNDLSIDHTTQSLLLITGPNMGGKSTYLRQAALIAIMAQMGSFVPATQAKLPLTDRIFTRIGASDNLARGRSTFLVEMSEVAAILNTATSASLVLLDEVGRGTATFDGLSIAWAVVEALEADARPRTLFATHYHELTELERLVPGVRNVHVSVREVGNEIIFLRRVEPGSADKSYGIEVARLAGLPASVIARAREVLRKHERSEHKLSEELTPGAAPPMQTPIFTAIDQSVLESLKHADLDQLKPIEALNLLAALKKQLS
ncbi:MAG: DNA mismatch repair protein MutS [Candidatus Acidiferrales bacterium]